MNPRSRWLTALVPAFALLLTACDIPGLDGDSKKAAAAEADSKAIGGACRLAMRGIEDCYAQNPDAGKAAVFAGWREMDEYMRENKVEGIPPVKPPATEEVITEPSPDAKKSGKGKGSANN